MMSSNLYLYCASSAVGTIRNPFYSDGTWYGVIELVQNSELAPRVLDYIRFVEEWNEKVHRNAPADPNEFNRYSDLVRSGLWYTKDESGNTTNIAEAPVFFVGGEISWRTD